MMKKFMPSAEEMAGGRGKKGKKGKRRRRRGLPGLPSGMSMADLEKTARHDGGIEGSAGLTAGGTCRRCEAPGHPIFA